MKGNIRYRVGKDGKRHYEARVEVSPDPGTGERRSKSRSFATKAEAERWVAETKAKVHSGAWADAGRATVGEYVDRWWAAHRSEVAPRSRDRYESVIHAQVLPAWKAARLSSVRTSDLRAWFARLRKEGRVKWAKQADGTKKLVPAGAGLSEDSLRYVRTVLHQSFALAVEDGLLPRNPVATIRLPQPTLRPVDPFTPTEVAHLFETTADEPLAAFFVVALTTGARAGEILAARWEDIDLDAGTWNLRASLQRVKGEGLQLGPPKTRTSMRHVELPALTVTALQRHQRRQKEQRMRAGPIWQDAGFVFCSTAGRPLDESNVYKRVWLPALDRAGLPRRRLHDARHTHASLLLDQGANVKVVADRLGHADPRILLQRYAHQLPGAQRRAAEQLDAVLTAAVDRNREHQA